MSTARAILLWQPIIFGMLHNVYGNRYLAMLYRTVSLSRDTVDLSSHALFFFLQKQIAICATQSEYNNCLCCTTGKCTNMGLLPIIEKVSITSPKLLEHT